MEEFEEESRLSSSLLYCLDGNEPTEEDKVMSFSQLNTRKRSLPFKGIGKENILADNKPEDSESYPKKILVAPGDVSL